MMNKRNVVLKDFETLPEAIIMRRLERLAYYSKHINIRAEQEFVPAPDGSTKREITFVVYNESNDILEIVPAHLDDLEAEFETLKTKWVLNYDNV